MAGLTDRDEARIFLADENNPVHRRCLAAIAMGLLGDEIRDKNLREAIASYDPRDESPLGRACWRAITHLEGGFTANCDAERREEALQKMSEFGWTDIAIAVRALGDRREARERRLAAAAILGGLRYRDATAVLINAIAEGDRDLAFACSSSLNSIKSRKHGRRLIDVLRKTSRRERIDPDWRRLYRRK